MNAQPPDQARYNPDWDPTKQETAVDPSAEQAPDQRGFDSVENSALDETPVVDESADRPVDETVDRAVDQVVHDLAQENDAAQAELTLQQQLDAANDQNLKLHAELDNVRKRVRRDAEEQIKYASLPLMADLLGVFDNLRRAIDAAGSSQSADGLIEGVQMVAKQFEDTLGKFHCLPIAADPGVTFDPHVHEAISQMPSDQYQRGTVLMEATKGFQLHQRVVRPSQVVVSTGDGQS